MGHFQQHLSQNNGLLGSIKRRKDKGLMVTKGRADFFPMVVLQKK
jgi:hypothetical protein